jgi:hypothetical protein
VAALPQCRGNETRQSLTVGGSTHYASPSSRKDFCFRETDSFCIVELLYSIFRIAVDRNHTLKWIFPQEKATLDELQKATLIRKMP